MAEIIQKLTWPDDEHLKTGVDFSAPSDKVVDGWLMMSNGTPVTLILAGYLYFIFYLGPKLMEGRKPFNLKYVMIVYNLCNVVFSSWLCWQLLGDPDAMSYIYQYQCAPKSRHTNHLVYKMNSNSWFYFVSKMFELLDTVFFVLRKKQNQITVLHVYHHANMVVSTWAYLKYIRGEQGLLIGFINSFVHIVMYSYYLLAAFGPRVQKYLWWKKYITKIQLGQFIIVLSYCAYLLIKNCQFPKGLTYYAVFQATVFLILFMNFYRKAYIQNKLNKEINKTKSS
ncbi:unnamed protein product [Nezara viridula]|uniref:Elongation of very long chain fatty acids protein n=1 Tax=Nezara viridula TaxID=85310 RepID=A0A9P0H5I3_NEZVI|nr:unnamed protein product [Nezara viridula]